MPFFQEKTGVLHYLSESDIENNGLTLLPADCQPITDTQAAAIQNPPLSFVQVRSAKLEEINAAAGRVLVELSASYPTGEVSSWNQQIAEADALETNLSASTPLLFAIAMARGLDVKDLATRVRAKRDAYAIASGKIIGQRQALIDAIMAIDLQQPDAIPQLQAIRWPDT